MTGKRIPDGDWMGVESVRAICCFVGIVIAPSAKLEKKTNMETAGTLTRIGGLPGADDSPRRIRFNSGPVLKAELKICPTR
jgi:hypothetical protein